MKTTKKGFTLVELLVVIAILAILATVSVVGYTTFIQKANKSVDQQAVVQMNLVLKADEIVNGAPQSIDQVKDLLEANGYSDELTPIFDGYTFGWYAEANVMVLVENRTHVDFPEEYRDVDLSKIELYLHNVVTEVVDNDEAISYINTGDISGGYVQLAEGTYTGLRYGLDMGKIVEQVGTAQNGWPIYEKLNKIGSLTIGGTGAKIDGFTIYSSTASDAAVNNAGQYYIAQKHEIQTLKFEDVTFTSGITIIINEGSNIKNLVFENVTFDMYNKQSDAAANIIDKIGGVENITFKNCKFINCSDVKKPIAIDLRCETGLNITITGCTFEGAAYNAIQIGGDGSKYTGKIVITNNTISNTANRGIRVASVAGQLVITNNTLTNATDEDGQAIKYQGTPTSAELGLNTHNDNDLVWSQVSDGWVATEE